MEGILITHSQDIILPEVTISAFTETDQEESSIAVPLQRAYTGRKPVITSRLADTPCSTLGVQGLLDRLNTTLGTSHTLNTPSLSSLLEDCIANNYDFGMAYGRLHRIWYTHDWSTVRDVLRKWEEKDREMRQATKLLTYPMTIASVINELSPYNIRKGGRMTPEGLKSFSGTSKYMPSRVATH